jgi:hypothetical protein
VSLYPAGFGYNVPTVLLLGWAVTDILIFVAVFPLLRKRALIYRLIEWGKQQMADTPADEELRRKRGRQG